MKPKDRVVTKDLNSIIYETGCSKREEVNFGKSKRFLKLRSGEHIMSFKNCDCEKNKIARYCWEADHNFSWDQYKVV